MDEIYYRTHHYRMSVVVFHIIKMIPGATFALQGHKAIFRLELTKESKRMNNPNSEAIGLTRLRIYFMSIFIQTSSDGKLCIISSTQG